MSNMEKVNIEKKYDTVIIGGGPGGYSTAIRLAQLDRNHKIALIDNQELLGGTCVNSGCIPTKALYHCAILYYYMSSKGKHYGFEFERKGINFSKLKNYIRRQITHNALGIRKLLDSYGVDVLRGRAIVRNKGEVEYSPPPAENNNTPVTQKLECDTIVLATGSKPIELPKINIDGKRVITHEHLFNQLDSLPTSIAIIGAGPEGVEFATALACLGVKVHLVEMLPRVLPLADPELSAELERALRRLGVTLHTGWAIDSLTTEGVKLKAYSGDDDDDKKTKEIKTDQVLMTIGRKPNFDGIELETLGLKYNKRGIEVNDRLQTNINEIYAVGDVTGVNLLAYVAYEQAKVVAENISGMNKNSRIKYENIPTAIFTLPEVAYVGLTENDLRSKNIKYHVSKYPFSASGKARCIDEPYGFAKILVDNTFEKRLLGVHMIGADATELIYSATLSVVNRLRATDFVKLYVCHPTLAEVYHDSVCATIGKALHLPPATAKKEGGLGEFLPPKKLSN